MSPNAAAMSGSREAAVASNRRDDVLAELDQIHDPCSVSIGHPIGLVGMGIIEGVQIEGSEVRISVLPTFPDCLFRGVFEEAIETRIATLPWCTDVAVAFCPADQSWDESRLSAEARQRLGGRAKTA